MGSSFLKIGVILAILSLSGKIPVDNDWLTAKVRIEMISEDIDFSIIVDMLSCPELDFGLSLLTIFSNWSVEMVLNWKEWVILSRRKSV